MTEDEWLKGTNTDEMLPHIYRQRSGWRKAIDRFLKLRTRPSRPSSKLYWFAVACGRRVWPSLTDQRAQVAVASTNRLLSGGGNEEETVVSWFTLVRDAHGSDDELMVPAVRDGWVNPPFEYKSFMYDVATNVAVNAAWYTAFAK